MRPVRAIARYLDRPGVRWTARVAAIGWATVIFAFSSAPGGTLPGRFGQAAHLLEYAVLGVLLYVSLREDAGDRRAAALAVLAAAAYALSDEFHQFFVPGRAVDAADWGTDVVGAAIGALATAAADAGARARAAEAPGRR